MRGVNIFNKNVRFDTAEELGINPSENCSKQYDLDKPLAWDFIDTGI